MSDPVTNVEIEDVLSSIRRLVSEGDKAKRDPAPPVETPSDTPEKLVLTPALRVTDDADDSRKRTSDPLKLVDPAPAAVFDDTPMAFVPAEVEDAEDTEEAIEADNPFNRVALEKSNLPFDRASLESTIAELEAAVTEQTDDWEPDGSETNIDPSWAAAGFASDQPVEDAEEVDDAPIETAVAEAVDIPENDTTETLVAQISDDIADDVVETMAGDVAAAVAAVTAAPVAEDDDYSSDDVVIPPMSFRRPRHDAEEEEQVAEEHGDNLRADDDAVQEEELAAYLADDAVIDEAMLRQLVLEIVRSELQGKLGERITRNVRKLVRREIHRVLTSQDID